MGWNIDATAATNMQMDASVTQVKTKVDAPQDIKSYSTLNAGDIIPIVNLNIYDNPITNSTVTKTPDLSFATSPANQNIPTTDIQFQYPSTPALNETMQTPKTGFKFKTEYIIIAGILAIIILNK